MAKQPDFTPMRRVTLSAGGTVFEALVLRVTESGVELKNESNGHTNWFQFSDFAVGGRYKIVEAKKERA